MIIPFTQEAAALSALAISTKPVVSSLDMATLACQWFLALGALVLAAGMALSKGKPHAEAAALAAGMPLRWITIPMALLFLGFAGNQLAGDFASWAFGFSKIHFISFQGHHTQGLYANMQTCCAILGALLWLYWGRWMIGAVLVMAPIGLAIAAFEWMFMG
jgi:hypothetical protein